MVGVHDVLQVLLQGVSAIKYQLDFIGEHCFPPERTQCKQLSMLVHVSCLSVMVVSR